MPENNSLPEIKNPVKFKQGELPDTYFREHLNSIKVTLLSAPTLEHLYNYIPQFATATWHDKPFPAMSSKEKEEVIKDLFEGKVLPTAIETINFTLLIEYMDLIDVTHLLRHRQFAFSAVCTADRDMRHDDCMIKSSIAKNPEYFRRFVEITNECKKLYADMVDSEEVSILDARTILPRALESHYFVHMNLRDVIPFLKQRLDTQIQPESDNIIALRMWVEIVKQYPQIKGMINVNEPDWWYIKTAPTGRSSNIYMPDEKNDVFDWNKQWFLYKKKRSDFPGGDVFQELWDNLKQKLELL